MEVDIFPIPGIRFSRQWIWFEAYCGDGKIGPENSVSSTERTIAVRYFQRRCWKLYLGRPTMTGSDDIIACFFIGHIAHPL